MKKILTVFFLFLSVTAVSQNKDYLVSLDGLGSLKLTMSLAELEQALKTKIILKVINVDSVVRMETINARYKGIDVAITLIKWQDNEVVVDGISTSSPLCKTASGIGIGSTRLQIIAAYEGYYIDSVPEYTEESGTLRKSKTNSTVTVKEDEEGYAIVFKLVNKKVVSIAVYPIFDDEEG